MTIGAGDDVYEDLEEGACHTMVHGPQGGWHMLGSVRACHTFDVVYIHFEIFDVESKMRISDNTYRVKMEMEEDGCCGTFPGMYGFLDMTGLRDGSLDTPPELICLNELELRMSVYDDSGRLVESSRRVIGAPHADDVGICDPGECLQEPGDSGGTTTEGVDSE